MSLTFFISRHNVLPSFLHFYSLFNIVRLILLNNLLILQQSGLSLAVHTEPKHVVYHSYNMTYKGRWLYYYTGPGWFGWLLQLVFTYLIN